MTGSKLLNYFEPFIKPDFMVAAVYALKIPDFLFESVV